MKSLFLLTYYDPYWTGLTQYAKRIAEGLVKRKIQVRVLTTQHQKILRLRENINNVQVIRKPFLFRLSRTLISPQFVFSFWNEIKETQSIIVFLPFAEVAIVALIAKILKKDLYLVHNGDLILPGGWKNRILEKIYSLSTSFAITISRKIIIHTEDYAKNSKLLSNHKNKWLVILPPFKIGEPNRSVEESLKKKIGWNGEKIIGFAGRFVEEKGFDYLLKAIPEIKKNIPNVIFVFAGETKIAYENFYQQNQGLIEINKDCLKFLGILEQKQMSAFYKMLDLFVVSSRTDCFPFVQVEALLSGVPVVVTDIPGARWPVRMTGMGKIVEKENPSALAEGIIEVLKNKKKYEKNKIKVAKIFDSGKTLDEYEKLITG